MSTRITRATTCAVLAIWSIPAAAGLSQSVIVSPGGFVQAGAYPSTATGGGHVAGGDLSAAFGLGADFHEMGFAGNTSAPASAAFASATMNLSAAATAGMGYFRVRAARTAPDESPIAAGIANGGWKETFTVSHPALTGQSGYFVFQIRARGSMNTDGFSGSAGLTTTGYKDNAELLINPFFDRTQSDPVGSDRQRASWGLASDHFPLSRTVDALITMSVPITFGQAFTLGVYATGVAGSRSQAFGITSSSSATLEFSGAGVTWNGTSSVQGPSGAVAGYTIVTATGLAWGGPLGEPCRPDLTTTAIPGSPGYGSPNGTVNNDDFFYYLAAFAAGNAAVADMSTTAVPGSPGYGIPNGVINNDDFFFYLTVFAAGC